MIEFTYRYRKWKLPCSVTFKVGIKLQIGGMWVGYHWSAYNRRLCINLIPCVTLWIAMPGGKEP